MPRGQGFLVDCPCWVLWAGLAFDWRNWIAWGFPCWSWCDLLEQLDHGTAWHVSQEYRNCCAAVYPVVPMSSGNWLAGPRTTSSECWNRPRKANWRGEQRDTTSHGHGSSGPEGREEAYFHFIAFVNLFIEWMKCEFLVRRKITRRIGLVWVQHLTLARTAPGNPTWVVKGVFVSAFRHFCGLAF
jgi:hypothetical protein